MLLTKIRRPARGFFPGRGKDRRRNRAAAAAVAMFLMGAVLAPGAPPPAHGSPGQPGAETEKRAVVLIPGPGGLGEDVWHPDEGGGLYRALTGAGFTPGDDLFALPGGYTDFTAAAENDLAPLMEELGRRRPITRVDFITHSAGVLTARYYIDTAGGGAPPVGQIIAIAPPSRGSWLADTVRASAFRRAMLEHVLRRSGGRIGANRLRAGGGSPGEMELVASLFDAVYPTYRKYLLRGRFLPTGSPQPFGEWLSLSDPALARDLADPLPPFGAGALPAPGVDPPGPGRDLSTAYYTRTALDAAGYVFQQTRPVYEVLAEQWWTGIVVTGEWTTTLAIWLTERAARLGFHLAGREVSRVWQEAVGRGFTALSGVEPLDDGLRRLVAENVAGAGSGPAAQVLGAGGDAGLPGNVWLAGWNSTRSQQSRGVRTVYIAGAVLPADSALAAGPMEGDGVVALGDAFLAGDADDEWHIVGGGMAAGHGALPRHKDVVAAVIRALQWDMAPGTPGGPAAPRDATPAGRGGGIGWSARLQASDAVPAYARVPAAPGSARPDLGQAGHPGGAGGAAGGARGPAEGLLLRAAVPPGSPGAWLWAWLTEPGGARRKVDIGHLSPGETRFIALEPGSGPDPVRITVGVRHHRGGGPRWLPPRTGAAHSRMAKTTATVELSLEPAGAARPGEVVPLQAGPPSAALPGGGPPPEPSRTAAAPARGEKASQPPPGHHGTPGPPSRPSGEVPPAANPPAAGPGRADGGGDHGQPGEPVIAVTRRSKQTARLKRFMPEHSYWEWHVDGAIVHRDLAGGTEGYFTYRFAAPGTRAVKARSIAADGTVLREKLWSVPVSAAESSSGREWEFIAHAPRAPAIRMELDGPVMWVTGRPARFQVKAEVEAPDYGRVVETGFDPGSAFQVIWARPGTGFPVEAAVYAVVRYDFPDGGTLTMRFTETAAAEVEVLALGGGG